LDSNRGSTALDNVERLGFESVAGCACRINDMLFGGRIEGVPLLPTLHDVHLYIKLSDRAPVLLFFNEISCMIASY